MDIRKLIGEATDYDKKLALEKKKPKSWCKSVSAFANTFGGSLIFGISNDDEIIGLEYAEGDAETISEEIKKRISPIPEFKLQFDAVIHKVEDKDVEFWLALELMALLGYERWENFHIISFNVD